MSKRIFFICGVPRSGTTAIAQLMNQHPAICCGIERYKYLFGRQRDFQRDCFTKERFFDFRDSDTNFLPSQGREWTALYDHLLTKWDDAILVGDKVPVLFKTMQMTDEVYPNARYVYMLRQIDRVASSWNVRALDPEDERWPAENDFGVAVEMWNSANKWVESQVRRRPETIHIVSYENFFGGEVSTLTRLCAFLEVDLTKKLIDEWQKSVSHYQNVIEFKQVVVLPGQLQTVREKANLSLYEKLLRRDSAPADSSFQPPFA